MEQKKQVFSNNSSDEYEEISEKKTSKLGYILLVLMVVFMIGIGQTIFSDLKKIPERPDQPSYCVSNLNRTGYLENMSYEQNCRFNQIDQRFNLDKQYNSIRPVIGEIISLNKKISDNERNINTKEREIDRLNRDYDLSLQEKIANEQAIMDKTYIKNNITQKKGEIIGLSSQNSSLKIQRNEIITKISSQLDALARSYDEAEEYYRDKYAFYKFKIFLLMMLFVLPFFGFSLYFYLKLKRKNSPYTIIFTAIVGASSILFLQIVLMFLYEVLPRAWFARVFRFFMEVPFLRYVIYYGSVILVIAIFGGLVYFIQKKVFSPEKVAIRRLKDNKCPSCSFTLNTEHNFCPKCGQQIKEKCSNCNHLKIRYLTHCPICGDDQKKQD